MTHRVLPTPRKAYRIGDAAGNYPVFSGTGAAQYPGRWNDLDEDMIYTSATYSTALLEKLVRLGELPANQHYVEIEIAAGVSYEVVTEASLPGWISSDKSVSKAFGSAWFQSRRSAILIVPSIVARLDENILINPHHPDFSRINADIEKPVPWDDRLFI